jgi:PHP family Zn ribbon phosphoesterase
MSTLRIICSKCNKPFTIREEDKETFECPTGDGGHAMGIGVCMPHNYSDEFSNRRKEKAPYT